MDQAALKWLYRHINERVLPTHPEAQPLLRYLENNRLMDGDPIRALETYVRLLKFLPSGAVYETGTLSIVSRYLLETGRKICMAEGDFRYQLNLPDQCADAILSFEVFEHIKDQEPKEFNDIVLFNFSGVRKYVSEMHRALKPGGSVLLTTPNPASLRGITEIMARRSPMIFYPHVKEYAPENVIALFDKGGFTCEHWDAFSAHFHLNDCDALLRSFFTDRGFSAENRGDTAFYVFRRRD